MCPSSEQDHLQRFWYTWLSLQYQHGQAIAEWQEAASAGDPVHRLPDRAVLWQTYGADRGGQEGS
jgi:hypothetical protein